MVVPAGMVTDVVRKIISDGWSLVTCSVESAAGAEATVTVPCTTEPLPEVTSGEIVNDTGLGDGTTVRSALTEVPFQVAVTVTGVLAATSLVVSVNVSVGLPAGTVIDCAGMAAGTVLVMWTTALGGADPLRYRIAPVGAPPVTVTGWMPR